MASIDTITGLIAGIILGFGVLNGVAAFRCKDGVQYGLAGTLVACGIASWFEATSGGSHATLAADVVIGAAFLTSLGVFIRLADVYLGPSRSAAEARWFSAACVGAGLAVLIAIVERIVAPDNVSGPIAAEIGAAWTALTLTIAFSEQARTARTDASEEDVAQVDRRTRLRTGEALKQRLGGEWEESLTRVDPLTLLPTREALNLRLAREWEEAIYSNRHVAVLMADVDDLRAYADSYGSAAGDRCLREITHAIAASIRRPLDFAVRYGDDEIVVLLIGPSAPLAVAVGERMRAAVDRLAIPHNAADFHTVSISVGVATRIPDRTTTPDVLVQASRIALNAAKRAGRNRVSLLERIEGEG